MKKKILPLLTLLLFSFSYLFAQGTHLIASQSLFTIEGTSTLHDWSMKTQNLKGEAVLEIKEGKLTRINSLTLTTPTKSLTSGKKTMDNNAWKALKAEDHPSIDFRMASIKSLVLQNGGTRLVVEGTITIAGVTRQETIIAEGHVNKQGLVSFQGKKQLKMSDYKVEAPSFMFGKFTTGDAITIHFNLTLQQNPLYTQN